ncbi:MAG: hypothetical protein M3N93_10095 [Acidobacteriota bacterium]|nr:hypothetical protein [Acidobacteriota bacterium]
MAKLIKILAASVGGGLVLGAGVRLGEAIATWQSGPSINTDKLAERLSQLEDRLQATEHEGSGVISRVEAQAQAVSAARSQLGTENQRLKALSETTERLRGEMRGWLEESVTAHMAEVESRLKAEAERGRRQMLDAFAENVQTRVIQRISRLEEEVAGQSAAMNELRECSLRTERSIQKLLGGLDRLVVATPAANPSKQDAGPNEVSVPKVSDGSIAV